MKPLTCEENGVSGPGLSHPLAQPILAEGIQRTLRTSLLLSLVLCADSAAQVPTEVPKSSMTKLSVRLPPSEGPGNDRALAEFDKYFLSTEHSLQAEISPVTLSSNQCGHVDFGWIRSFTDRNKFSTEELIPPGTAVTLPPCPFWRLGGTVTIHKGETVGGALLRTVGQAGPQMLARVAKLNNRPVAALDHVDAGETLKVPFVTAPVSYPLRPEYSKRIDDVKNAINSLPGGKASLEVSLTLIGENIPECEAGDSIDEPFDPNRVADILQRNAQVRPPFRKTIVAIIDTGIDPDEKRLSLAADANGRIGANMDKRQTGFPTSASTYPARHHGTHVAGLALGGLKSERLTDAVKSRIALRIVNIVSRDVLADSTGAQHESFSIPLTNLQEAIAYARGDPPIPILNLSVETDSRLESMLTTFKEGDYLAIVAAGNDGRDTDLEPVYPAGFKRDLPNRFLTVAAHKKGGSLASFSNRGPEGVDIAAPGCRITSILPDGGSGPVTGTSQAAPLVTFAAALLYSEGLSIQEVRNRIKVTASLEPDSLRAHVVFGRRLDIERALSIHDDLISIRAQPEPLRGRIVDIDCVEITDRGCVDLDRIARLVASLDPETALAGVAWLYGTDGELHPRPTQMPSGVFKFEPYGGKEAKRIKWEDVTDLVLAKRKN